MLLMLYGVEYIKNANERVKEGIRFRNASKKKRKQRTRKEHQRFSLYAQNCSEYICEDCNQKQWFTLREKQSKHSMICKYCGSHWLNKVPELADRQLINREIRQRQQSVDVYSGIINRKDR